MSTSQHAQSVRFKHTFTHSHICVETTRRNLKWTAGTYRRRVNLCFRVKRQPNEAPIENPARGEAHDNPRFSQATNVPMRPTLKSDNTPSNRRPSVSGKSSAASAASAQRTSSSCVIPHARELRDFWAHSVFVVMTLLMARVSRVILRNFHEPSIIGMYFLPHPAVFPRPFYPFPPA